MKQASVDLEAYLGGEVEKGSIFALRQIQHVANDDGTDSDGQRLMNRYIVQFRASQRIFLVEVQRRLRHSVTLNMGLRLQAYMSPLVNQQIKDLVVQLVIPRCTISCVIREMARLWSRSLHV